MPQAFPIQPPELYPWHLGDFFPFESLKIAFGCAVVLAGFAFALTTKRVPPFLRPLPHKKFRARRKETRAMSRR